MESQSSTQSYRGRSKRRSRSASRSASRSVSRGFLGRPQRSLTLKTNGEYKMTRSTSIYLPYTNAGFAFPTLYPGGGFTFYPDYVQAVSSTTGSTITANIPNYAELAGVWDRVYLDNVEIVMSNRTTDPAGGTTTNNSTPILYFANDFTNNLNTTIDVIQQMQGMKTWKATSDGPDFVWNVKPMFQQLIYYSATLPSSYAPGRGYVTSDSSVPHYGVRFVMDQIGVGNGGINFRFKYTYKFKDVK